MTDAGPSELDPEGRYAPADIVVSARPRRGVEPSEGPAERMPAREVIYRVVLERGPISLQDLVAQLPLPARRTAPAPYADAPELYLLRLIAGARCALPPLCDLQTIVRSLVETEADPDYAFDVRPA